MKKLISILCFVMLWPLTPSRAQLFPANDAGITLSSWHTIVRDVEATKKFWALFGGTPMKIDEVDVIRLPGVFVFMHPGEPSGPSRGAVIDHVGVNSPNPYDLVKRLVAAGVRMDRFNPETLRGLNWKPGDIQRAWAFAYSPDGLRVEISLNPCTFGSSHPNLEACPESLSNPMQTDPAAPIGSDILHFYLDSDGEVKRLYDFYTKSFGGKIVRGANVNVVIPGVKFNIVTSDEGPRPSNKGRALSGIGFEVKNLEQFSKKLEAAGVKFDQPYSRTRHKSFASAEFTDRWRTPVHLTEGLNRFAGAAAQQGTAARGLAHARQVFAIHCSYCHQADSYAGRGDAPGLKDLFKRPPHKLTDGTEHTEHTVANIRKLLVEGNRAMPARGIILSDEEMDDLMAYLQTL